MKTEWYGDKRDLVKWATLVHLCHEHKLEAIVQIAFLQESNPPKTISMDGDKKIEFHQAVWKHFKDLHDIKRLETETGLKIEVIIDTFSHKGRLEYSKQVCSCLKNMNVPKAVLLDPDTGIEPKKASVKHVMVDEIGAFWQILNKGDWLVVYQHAPRIKNARLNNNYQKERFAEACGWAAALTFASDKIAHDVVFYAAKKS